MANILTEEYGRRCGDLERQELESPGGVATPEVYTQLLALYILQNDLCNAKYLWKRIPQNVKTSHPELGQVWAVGQKLWQRDFSGVYVSLNQEWSDNIQSIMTLVGERTRQRAVNLVSQAYSSICTEDFANFVGMPNEQATQAAIEHGWGFDESNGMILPKKQDVPVCVVGPSEEHLARLTDFVSFLET